MADDSVENVVDAAADAHAPEPSAKPRLKLDLDSLPEQTSDDLAQSWGESIPDDATKRQNYLSEKPPHHGD
jgi:hypothetical protein